MKRETKSLTTRGYGIPFSQLSDEERTAIKKELTVAPRVAPIVNTTTQDKSFPLYRESDVKLYVPKNYGLSRFGVPDRLSLPQGEDIGVSFSSSLRPEQETQVSAFMQACQDPLRRGGIINVGCGGGKCLARDTLIVMFDKTLKCVQDVVPGDLLRGDDARPRSVTTVCRGQDALFEIRPRTPYASAYTVNHDHILTLQRVDNGEVRDISLRQFLQFDQDVRDLYRGFTLAYEKDGCGSFRTKLLPQELPQKIARDIVHRWRSHGYLVHYDAHTETVFDIRENHDASPRFTYAFDIVPKGTGTYYGFTLDDRTNRRFLLADCTVTHNTVMALHIVSRLAKKTLIIVHKEFLIQQWKERIDAFLPGARVGLIKAKSIDIENKDIVLGSLQSLSIKPYADSLFETFGLVIVDEVHRTGTEVFSHALHRAFCYSLGLTATLQRKDGMTKVFKWYLGDAVLTPRKQDKKHNAAKVLFLDIPDEDPSYRKEVTMYNGNLNCSKMMNNIAGFAPRTLRIIDLLERVFEESGKMRKILVLSERKSQLQDMADHLRSRYISHGFYVGGMKDHDLKESEKKSVILATYSFASEGFDVADLDTVILATPRSDIEQSVGRIFRKKPEERQRLPLIIDVQDDFSLFAHQNKKRSQYYKKCNFSLERVKTG